MFLLNCHDRFQISPAINVTKRGVATWELWEIDFYIHWGGDICVNDRKCSPRSPKELNFFSKFLMTMLDNTISLSHQILTESTNFHS